MYVNWNFSKNLEEKKEEKRSLKIPSHSPNNILLQIEDVNTVRLPRGFYLRKVIGGNLGEIFKKGKTNEILKFAHAAYPAASVLINGMPTLST